MKKATGRYCSQANSQHISADKKFGMLNGTYAYFAQKRTGKPQKVSLHNR